MNKIYVFDTSAFLTLIRAEDGVNAVEAIIARAKKNQVEIFISFISLTELYYTVLRGSGQHTALEIMALIKSLPIICVYPNDEMLLHAGFLKVNHSLSLADAFIAATALEKKAILVHKDPEFKSLAPDLAMIELPYKIKT